ncbi:alpha/beta fold hydrolase [Diplocloster agilis]|uniref:alpha/beta fold hydrolase n=1 Tax=Diplocloster agilis TaxID=2850323 RepID=UPI0008206B48|nr:alpha/beta hydrolase [Suonthocola fibrivorans]MCU6732094.1 alpha/beta hydrolase [Suonthocola fibrivorans]SCI33245.1 Non-heme chloroperoxidase [uncultured Clostridium sp.]
MNITVQNIRTNYTVSGEGEDVLILHGWGSNLTVHNQMAAYLAPHYRVYALDMPGFGETPEPPAAWDVDHYVDFVLEFIREMGIRSVILIGHSFGGRVIIKMVTRQNLSVTFPKLILIDSAGILPKKTLKQKCKIRIYKLGKKILNISIVKKLYPDALEKIRAKSGSADYNAASPLMRQVLVKVVNEDLTPYLASIPSPTLLIWGELDTATPLADGQLMEKLIPGAGLVTVKGAGHFSFLESSYLVHKVIGSFLNIKE